MKIVVKRNAGDAFAPDISDGLICEIPVALQRGRIEMDLGEGLIPVEQDCVFRANAAVGDLAESFDAMNGAAWRGLATAVEHALTARGELITKQSFLRRPA